MKLIASATIAVKLVSESNNTDHWTKKAKRKKQVQMLTRMALKASKWPMPCVIVMTRISARNLDDDNLRGGAFKCVRDEIARMILGGRLGQKDSDPGLTWVYKQEKSKISSFRIDIYDSLQGDLKLTDIVDGDIELHLRDMSKQETLDSHHQP